MRLVRFIGLCASFGGNLMAAAGVLRAKNGRKVSGVLFYAARFADCAAAGSGGCKVSVVFRQLCSASERRINRSEYASVMVLMRRVNEFTALRNKYMSSSACLTIFCKPSSDPRTRCCFPKTPSSNPIISCCSKRKQALAIVMWEIHLQMQCHMR